MIRKLTYYGGPHFAVFMICNAFALLLSGMAGISYPMAMVLVSPIIFGVIHWCSKYYLFEHLEMREYASDDALFTYVLYMPGEDIPRLITVQDTETWYGVMDRSPIALLFHLRRMVTTFPCEMSSFALFHARAHTQLTNAFKMLEVVYESPISAALVYELIVTAKEFMLFAEVTSPQKLSTLYVEYIDKRKRNYNNV